jgi:regulator of protease activity HflC (stomatin/prohibitin superfamily)
MSASPQELHPIDASPVGRSAGPPPALFLDSPPIPVMAWRNRGDIIMKPKGSRSDTMNETRVFQEHIVRPAPGAPMLAFLLVAKLAAFAGIIYGANQRDPDPLVIVSGIVVILAAFVALFGLMVVSPNDSKVLVLFGSYQGVVKEPGFYWVNPFNSKKFVSLKVRNFETGVMETAEVKDATGKVTQSASKRRQPAKVNDRDGNPIEIAAVVVWQVVDTSAALFAVDDYVDFVHVQSESALRGLATRYHYDHENDEVHSLRGNTTQVAEELQRELQERLNKAGVEVLEARISHLAYAPEIASAMLQRQQASAVIAARAKIVEGAVGMVEMALHRLQSDKVIDLDPERRAAMVSNLMVVLCGHGGLQPVINAGTLY